MIGSPGSYSPIGLSADPNAERTDRNANKVDRKCEQEDRNIEHVVQSTNEEMLRKRHAYWKITKVTSSTLKIEYQP